jgi:addiction module antidote protein HigA
MTHSRLQNYNTNLGKLILEDYLTPLNLTIGDLAKALNVHRNTISALLNGKASLTTGMAMKLGKALGVSPEFLLTFQVMSDIRQLKSNKVFQEELDNIEPLIKK